MNICGGMRKASVTKAQATKAPGIYLFFHSSFNTLFFQNQVSRYVVVVQWLASLARRF